MNGALTLSEIPAELQESFDLVGRCEAIMVNSDAPKANCELTHRFTPGIYSREIFMPAGSLISSKVHLLEHQAVIISGLISVFSGNEGPVLYRGGDVIITKENTKRLLFAHEDTRWITFHTNPTNTQDLASIENDIIMEWKNPYLEPLQIE